MSSGSGNSNEIQDMRNSMKMNFVNHLRTSKEPQMPSQLDLHTQIKQNKIKDPAPLTFKMKDKTLDWSKINQTQISSRQGGVDMAEINPLLKNLTYASIEPSDLQKFGCQRSAKVFKLMQLSIEYMNHTQNYVEDLLQDYEDDYYCVQKGIEKLNKKCQDNKRVLETDTIRKKKFKLRDFEIMFRDVGIIQQDDDVEGTTKQTKVQGYQKGQSKLNLQGAHHSTLHKHGDDSGDHPSFSSGSAPFESNHPIKEESKQSKRYRDTTTRSSKTGKQLGMHT